MAPTAKADPSTRISTLKLADHIPYVEFPFDVYNGGPIVIEGKMGLDDVCETEFLCRFGRPL